jgi:HSP20 family molecular chaperone IbpA
MSLFPRVGEFAPIFRLLDDYDVHRSSRGGTHGGSHVISNFSPRFDVRETKDAYLLDGEVPGINQKDVDIEFSDPQTLVIKGRVAREYHSGNNDDNDHGDNTDSRASSPRPATVEDAPEEGEAAVQKAVPKTEVSKPTGPQHKFWVSERSVGEFHRTFSFPTRVDQDAVKASLKNGVLSVAVPKASRQAARKITIE